MSIDFTRPLQTRDGRKVRLLCTDAHEPYPVMVLYEDTKQVSARTSDGKFLEGINSPADLMNVPEEFTVDLWVNVSGDGNIGFGHSTKERALAWRGSSSNAILHIQRTVPVGHVDE